MSLLGDLLAKLGLHGGPDANVIRDSVPGVHLRCTRDLRPLPATGLTAGHLLELYAILDERYAPPSNAEKIRFDVLEEDVLVDDRVVSLLGTGAQPPVAGATTRQLATQIFPLPDGETVASFVESYKRTITGFEDVLLVITEVPDPLAGHTATRRSHILAWLRVAHDDIGDHSELYFALDIAGVMHASSPILEIAAAPPGVSVRVTGSLRDAAPLDAATAEPCPEIPVALDVRRTATGEGGDFVVDARLSAGDHPLTFSRPGINPVTLTVGVTIAADGKATAVIRDAQNAVLVSATTAGAATQDSLLTLAIPNPVAVVVHKLRGTVWWPDSVPPAAPGIDHIGTPLAERRVYALPLPVGVPFAAARPKSTRDWEALKARTDVLRSARPGAPAQAELTDISGRFEVRYMDFTPGSRFLIWVERLDPGDPDQTRETPDFVVSTIPKALIQLTADKLTTTGDAGFVTAINRNLVNHEYARLTGDCVPVAVEALRVVEFPPPDGLALVRPMQTGRVIPPLLPGPTEETRTLFETEEPLQPGTGDAIAIPDSHVVDGLDLFALPLVPVFESTDAQGSAARAATAALDAQGETAFADYEDIPPLPALEPLVGHDRAPVRLVVDTARLANAIDYSTFPGPSFEPTIEALAVKLLESTLIVRPQLGRGKTLGVADAHWHFDATSLADNAFVTIDPGAPTIATRRLIGTIHPVLAAVSPLLPALAPRRVYLGMGHGLAAKPGKQTSVLAGDWSSVRGGYAENAGEDETVGLMASELARILDVCGARAGTTTCRELYDYTTPGVRMTANRVFATVAGAEFPRLWQQNPIYFLGIRGLAADRAALAGFDSLAGNKIDAALSVRPRHIEHLALNDGVVDLVYFQHTNAAGGGAPPGVPAPAENPNRRGLEVEFLGVFAAGGDARAGGGFVPLTGQGNELGFELATRLHTRIAERLKIEQRGVAKMSSQINGSAVRDLFETYDHWANPGVAVLDADRLLNRPNPGAGWQQQTFRPPGGVPMRLPIALAEHAFHDNRDDARLLSRPWFRRLAAEGAALAIDAQLQVDADPVPNEDVLTVLQRTFGETQPLRGLRAGAAGPATAAAVTAAVRAVGDAGAPTLGGAAPWIVIDAAMTAARALSRQTLVDRITAAVRTTAGWEATDAPSTIALWVGRAITGGLDLDRPDRPATREDAGTLACNTIGLTPASIATAERVGAGAPPSPLIRPAAVPIGQSAYFGPVEADALAARLAAMRRSDLYRVADAYLADGGWSRLDTPRGSKTYVLDAGTPLTVIFRTAGVPWKTFGQNGTNGGVTDTEIRAVAAGQFARLPCASRTTRLVASTSWFLDLPPGFGPGDVTLELWVRHRAADRPLLVGQWHITVSVPALPTA